MNVPTKIIGNEKRERRTFNALSVIGAIIFGAGTYFVTQMPSVVSKGPELGVPVASMLFGAVLVFYGLGYRTRVSTEKQLKKEGYDLSDLQP